MTSYSKIKAVTPMVTLLALAGTQAQTAPASAAASAKAPPPPTGFEKFIADSKKPADWMSWGADLRARDEYMDNVNMGLTPDELSEINQFRTRARVWTTVTPADIFDINARLTYENRYFFRPDSTAISPTGNRFVINSFELDEAVVDNLNFRLFNVLDKQLSLTVGRQDLFGIFGDSWLVGDGTPLDGSRTMHFDAARLTFDSKDLHTTFNAVYIDQGGEADRWLPPINSQDYRNFVTEQDERGLILYGANKSVKNLQIDGYFIWKQENPIYGTRYPSYDSDIYTGGVRLDLDINPHLKWKGEIATQYGNRTRPVATPAGYQAGVSQDVEALGAKTQFIYSLKDKLKNQFRMGYEYLSGDDRGSTDTNERFDILWGRYPQVSELLAYNPVVGPRPAEWGNYQRPMAGWSFSPAKKVDFSTDYSAFFAMHNELAEDAGFFRGHLWQSVLRYTHNKHLKAHLCAEMYWPGDYYDGFAVGGRPAQKDMEMFLRAEVFLTW